MSTPTQAGFRAIPRPSGVVSVFDLLVVDNDGLPHLPLSAFYARVQGELSPRTPRTYLTVLLPFFTWATSSSLHPESQYLWDGPPEQVRALVRDYLLNGPGSAVRRRSHEQNQAAKPSAKPTAQTVRLFLAALKRFYGFAVDEGWYLHDEPSLPRLSLILSDVAREALRAPQR